MSLQGIVRFLLPREDRFYDFLERQAELVHEGAVTLSTFKDEGSTAGQVRDAVQSVEHQGDKMVHDMEEALCKTFITPIDREDLQKLSSEIDDVLDLMNGAARACVLLGVDSPTVPMRELMTKLVECTEVIRRTVPRLRKHEYGMLLAANRELRALEKRGDSVYRDALHKLFHDGALDARVILREKEVLEMLERAIDHCEQVGDTFAHLAIKHG